MIIMNHDHYDYDDHDEHDEHDNHEYDDHDPEHLTMFWQAESIDSAEEQRSVFIVDLLKVNNILFLIILFVIVFVFI